MSSFNININNMKITLEENEFNYIYNILMSLPIRELEKVQQILKVLESKQESEQEPKDEDVKEV
jgi:hypothetical protein